MKRLTIGLFSTIGIMSIIILFLLSNALSVSSPRIRLIERSINERDYTKFVVSRGNLEDQFIANAFVTSLNNPISTIDYDLTAVITNPKVTVLKLVGEKFVQGEALFQIGDHVVNASTNGKVVAYEESLTNLTFTYLDYEKLLIKTQIPESLEPLISSLTPTQVQLNGEYVDAQIQSIDTQVVNQHIDVYIQVDGLDLLPGSSVSIALTIGTYSNVSYVRSDYIYTELGSHYLYLLSRDGKSVSKIPVVIVQTLQSMTIIQALEEQYYFREFIIYND